MPAYSEEIEYFVNPNNGYFNYLRKRVTNKLGEPYNKCEDNTDSLNNSLANDIRSRGFEYKQSYCYNLCRLKHIEIACNCSLHYQLWQTGIDTCNKTCIQNIIDKFDSSQDCEDCPLECDLVKYETSIVKMDQNSFETVIIDNRRFTTERFQNYSIDSLKGNTTVFNFNFADMHYYEIEETPRTNVYSLIGDLGGIVGNYFFNFYQGFSFFQILIII